jgi:hypothetical protein
MPRIRPSGAALGAYVVEQPTHRLRVDGVTHGGMNAAQRVACGGADAEHQDVTVGQLGARSDHTCSLPSRAASTCSSVHEVSTGWDGGGQPVAVAAR